MRLWTTSAIWRRRLGYVHWRPNTSHMLLVHAAAAAAAAADGDADGKDDDINVYLCV